MSAFCLLLIRRDIANQFEYIQEKWMNAGYFPNPKTPLENRDNMNARQPGIDPVVGGWADTYRSIIYPGPNRSDELAKNLDASGAKSVAVAKLIAREPDLAEAAAGLIAVRQEPDAAADEVVGEQEPHAVAVTEVAGEARSRAGSGGD